MNKKPNLFIARVKFSGLGGFQEKLVSELLENGIELSEISYSKGIMTAIAPADLYFDISRAAAKHGVRLKAEKRYGLRYKLYHLRRRYGIILGLLGCCLAILILSQFIWEIRISGNEKITDRQIYALLNDCGASIGALTSSFDTKACELKAMSEIDDISWISVACEGSCIYVKIGEEIQPESEEVPYNAPCNIVSDVDGQIVSAYIKRGDFKSKTGNGIHKGQLLVSGAVDDNGGHTIFVHANADITARYKTTQEFYLPFKQSKNVPGDITHTVNYLMIGGYSMPLWFSEKPDNTDNMQYKENIREIKLVGLTLPFKIKTGTFTEYKREEVTYTNRDLQNMLVEQSEEYEQNFLKDKKIVSRTKSFVPSDAGITLKIEYTLEGQIGKKVPINYFY